MAPLITIPSRWLNPLVLVLTLALSSCGGGTNTAGAGGSGIGGTGITTVTGNVSQVITDAPQEDEEEQAVAGRMLARAIDWLASPVNAQSISLDGNLSGIRVFGGGQVTTTDDDGSFVLEDVTPSDNFTLRFELEDNRTIALPLGAIPAGSVARVNDIVLNVPQGVATPANIEIEENVGGSAPENAGKPNNPGQSGGASDNNNATGASGNSSPNSSEQANNASNNNNAGGASSGANANND